MSDQSVQTSSAAQSVPTAPLTLRGSPLFPEVAGGLPPSTLETIDNAVATVRSRATAWTQVRPDERVAILDRLIQDTSAVADRWVSSCMDTKGLTAGEAGGEEWLTGPHPLIRNLRLLKQSLLDISKQGRPSIPGPITVSPAGQVVARVFPQSVYDRLLFQGVTSDVWMQPEVSIQDLPNTQAVAYAPGREAGEPKVCLVLAAGNASCIGPMDALYKLFVENQAVVYKSHPVNACLGPLLEAAFRCLIEYGAFRVVHGGAAEGAYLCRHPGVDEIHITGSDKTFDAIVFGSGEEGTQRKIQRSPLLHKRVTAELGNISPVIVVPGPWSRADLLYHAENLATTLATNAGFFCVTSRVIIQHSEWRQRQALLNDLSHVLGRLPIRKAYYPGAAQRHAAFLAAHPTAEMYGGGPSDDRGRLPWTLIRDLDPAEADEICFATEAFCPVIAETAIQADSVADFIDRAVHLANERLWGSLAATIIVHPQSLHDPEISRAVDRAIASLRYGTVAINHWALLSYSLVTAPWGAYPGNDIYDVGSGIGVVHNTMMFGRPQKTVLHAPFRVSPKPPWFVTFEHSESVARELTFLEANPTPYRLSRVMWQALRH